MGEEKVNQKNFLGPKQGAVSGEEGGIKQEQNGTQDTPKWSFYHPIYRKCPLFKAILKKIQQ